MVEIDHEKYQFEQIGEEERQQQPFYRENYDRTLSGESWARRVLSFITDEVDGPAGGIPRNTPTAVGTVLVNDGEAGSIEDVEQAFEELHNHGFIEQRDDGTWERTEDGWVELSN